MASHGEKRPAPSAGNPMTSMWVGAGMMDLSAPKAENLDLGFVVRTLSRQVRFNGHTAVGWSVAAHSMLCGEIWRVLNLESKLSAEMAAPWALRAVLMHDFGEAYVGDVVKPVRNLGLEALDSVEARLLGLCRKRWAAEAPSRRQSAEFDKLIEAIDMMALSAEIKRLFPAEALKHYPWLWAVEPEVNLRFDEISAACGVEDCGSYSYGETEAAFRSALAAAGVAEPVEPKAAAKPADSSLLFGGPLEDSPRGASGRVR